MFETKNILTNPYLIKKAKEITFEIPVQFVHDEYSIKDITTDRNLVNQVAFFYHLTLKALLKAKNLTAIQKSDVIEAVKPKPDQIKCNMSIKGVPGNIQNDLKTYITSQVQPGEVLSLSLKLTILDYRFYIKSHQ
jgi:hypothetical protein